jgi:hypothetical protein
LLEISADELGFCQPHGEDSLKEKDETAQKVYVNPEGLTVIKCPVCSCEKPTRVDSSVIREKNLRNNCLVRCTCQKKFAVKLEFRRDSRKNSNLSGEYVCLPTGKPRGRMTVVNISPHGIGLQIDDSNRFSIGDKLLIMFSLDETEDSLIDRRAEIRVVKENYIGCEFIGSFTLGKALGAYLADNPKEERQFEDDDEQFDWSTMVRG